MNSPGANGRYTTHPGFTAAMGVRSQFGLIFGPTTTRSLPYSGEASELMPPATCPSELPRASDRARNAELLPRSIILKSSCPMARATTETPDGCLLRPWPTEDWRVLVVAAGGIGAGSDTFQPAWWRAPRISIARPNASPSSLTNIISTGCFGLSFNNSRKRSVWIWRAATCLRSCSSFSSASFVRAPNSAVCWCAVAISALALAISAWATPSQQPNLR